MRETVLNKVIVYAMQMGLIVNYNVHTSLEYGDFMQGQS